VTDEAHTALLGMGDWHNDAQSATWVMVGGTSCSAYSYPRVGKNVPDLLPTTVPKVIQ